ncbi:MAG: M14 family metallopeptidase [Kiloniellales bacterium]
MDALSCFAPTYAAARRKFLEAAEAAGADITSHVNPAMGPDGTDLACDVASLGPADAKQVLMVNSSTHGAEGFFGSAVQVSWLRNRGLQPLPPDVKVVLVHAINPYGFAWVRRTNEDNIDINRNFIDHDKGHPENPGYEALHSALLPEDWNEESEAAFAATAEAFIAEQGQRAFEAALTGGQYAHADGIFYGGTEPCWSNRTIEAIAKETAGDADALVFLDLHTGLGSWGFIEIIHRQAPDGRGESWLKTAFGNHSLGSLARGDSASTASSDGLVEVGVARALPGKRIVACALEAGTRPVPQVLRALRADNWLHVHGTLDSDLGRTIKEGMREAFGPPERDWREIVLVRTRQILDSALAQVSEA